MNPIRDARWATFLTLTILGLSSMFQATTSTTVTVPPVVSQISSQLCGVVNIVRGVIGLLALMLFVIGGALYAIAHFLPQAGQIRANVQGWSMGILMGGVVGILLVLVAPFAINTVIGFGGNSIPTVNC